MSEDMALTEKPIQMSLPGLVLYLTDKTTWYLSVYGFVYICLSSSVQEMWNCNIINIVDIHNYDWYKTHFILFNTHCMMDWFI